MESIMKLRPLSKTKTKNKQPTIDAYIQLFNSQEIGDSLDVQTTWNIRRLRGIAWTIAPADYRTGGLLDFDSDDPATFYDDVSKHWLSRHPVLSKAEVRDNGRGLDVVLRLDKPIYFSGSSDSSGWSAVVQVVLAALPVPRCHPFLAPMVRALGSLNSSTRRKVVRLQRGERVTKREIRAIYQEMSDHPFRTVMKIITGSTRIKPCPVCCAKGSSLVALDEVGKCKKCGDITLTQLYNLTFKPPQQEA